MQVRLKILSLIVCFTSFNLAIESAKAETFIARSGNVKAELSSVCLSIASIEDCQKQKSSLTIVRGGQTVLAAKTIADEYTIIDSNAFKVMDLDGDSEPEVIVNTYTGGAHCCTLSSIYRYEAAKNTYSTLEQDWQNGGYRLEDLDGDGLVEFVSRDERFAYTFDSYAASGYPVQIWQYRQGKSIDVTRRYPKQIYESATRNWQYYLEGKKEGFQLKGFLAAYLGDKYLLDQGEDAWNRVKLAYQESDREEFFTDLRKFLQETGYMR